MNGDQHRTVRGQSLVEFALIVSVVSLMLLGLLDVGRAFHAYIVITNAAREGARYGTMHPEDGTGIRTRAISEAENSGIVVVSDDVGIAGSGVSGDPMVVTVDYDFALLTAWVVGRDSLSLRGRAEMVNY